MGERKQKREDNAGCPSNSSVGLSGNQRIRGWLIYEQATGVRAEGDAS